MSKNIKYKFNPYIIYFFSENGVGDRCENDYDIDDIPNHLDNCPNNSKIWSTDFRYLIFFYHVITPIKPGKLSIPKWTFHVTIDIFCIRHNELNMSKDVKYLFDNLFGPSVHK